MADQQKPQSGGANPPPAGKQTGGAQPPPGTAQPAGGAQQPTQPLTGGSQQPGTPPPAGTNPQPPPSGFDNPLGPFPGGMNPPTPPQPPKEDTTPANYQIGKHLPKVINVKIPPHSLQFDEQYFLHMLAGSISLTRDEKKRIIDSMPRLKQAQVDELIRIFEEERRKFAELSAKHVEQLKKLEKQHWAEWQDLELAQKASEKKEEDTAKAEEIRKKLGLG